MKITDGDRDWVHHPELTLEDVEKDYFTNQCSGRGSDTAAARGYNVEKLANAVFDPYKTVHTHSEEAWHDTAVWGNKGRLLIESKSCISRYPSGGYGQFRIWWLHHRSLTNLTVSTSNQVRLYFFLVYIVDNDGDAKEMGKLAVEAGIIDELITNWQLVDHTTKGLDQIRDISWHLLLSRLGVSVKQFRENDIVIVTDGTID